MSFLAQIRGIGRDAMVYGTADALGKLVSIITAPILTRIFTPDDYGVISLMQTVVGVFVLLAGLNLGSGTYYYFFRAKSPEDQDVVLSTAIYFTSSLSLLLAIGAWLAAPAVAEVLQPVAAEGLRHTSHDYVAYLRILSIGIFFGMMETQFNSYLRMTRQPKRFMALSLVKLGLTVGLVLYLVVYLRLGIEGSLWAGVLATVVTALLGSTFVMHRYRAGFSRECFVKLMGYAMPQFPAVVIGWGMLQLNRLFLNEYATLTQLGYYSIATQIASVVLLLLSSFRMAYDPFALSIINRPDADHTYARMYTAFSVGFAVLGATFALFAKPVLLILTPAAYHAGYAVTPLLVFAFVIQGANNVLGVGIWISERTSFTSWAQLIAFVANIAANFLLIPRYGAMGAAGALAIGMATQGIAYYAFGQRLHPIPFAFWRQQRLLLALLAVVMAHAYLVRDAGFLETVLMAFLFVPAIPLLAWVLGLDRADKQRLMDLAGPFLLRLRGNSL